MGATPIYGIPYPEDGQVIAASVIKSLAEAAEAAIAAFSNPNSHTVNLSGSWNANPSAPLTFYRLGRFVVFTGEIYRTSGSGISVGNIPASFRPNVDRVRVVSKSSNSSSNIAFFTVNQSGVLTLEGAGNNSTTPGYSLNGTYVVSG